MADLVYRKVIDPWLEPGSFKAGEGLSMKLTRKRQREIEESRGTLERLCEYYAHASFLGSDELWLTARYLCDLRAHLEGLLRLVQMVPESGSTLAAKLRSENHLRAGIARASRMESDLSKRAKDASQSAPPSAWQAAVTGDFETLLSQTFTVLASTRDLLGCLGRS